MKSYRFTFFLFILVALILLLTWFHTSKQNNFSKKNHHGPHGGHLFEKDKIALELKIFANNMPAHFRAYIYQQGQLLSPTQSQLHIELKRFDGTEEKITFIPAGHFLQSKEVIHDPHSFDLSIYLKTQGKQVSWQAPHYQNRIKIIPAILEAAQINVSTAKAERIKKQLRVVGKITPNRDTLAPIYARYSGIIKIMNKNLGDEVPKGEVLATIESNESLQNYHILSPISGTVVGKYASNGELTQGQKPIYEVANLTDVWADLTIYRQDASLIRQGMNVLVAGLEGTPLSHGTISYVAPLGIEDSQTLLARVVLSNEKKQWVPGMYVNANIVIHEQQVPVVVSVGAIQHLNDKDILFVQQGDFFEATPVTLGEQDQQWVEVKSGLKAGQHYVSQNSFFLKAELGKEQAAHEH